MSHRNAPLTATGRARMVALVIEHQWPQRRVAERFGVAPATVNRWVNRYRAGEPLPVRKAPPRRYEKSHPGELVHVDIKKLGRIPDGGGWRMFGRGSDQHRASSRASDAAARAGASPSRGYRYLHQWPSPQIVVR